MKPITALQVRRRTLCANIRHHLAALGALTDDLIAARCKVPLSEARAARRQLRGAGVVVKDAVRMLPGGKREVAWRLKDGR